MIKSSVISSQEQTTKQCSVNIQLRQKPTNPTNIIPAYESLPSTIEIQDLDIQLKQRIDFENSSSDKSPIIEPSEQIKPSKYCVDENSIQFILPYPFKQGVTLMISKIQSSQSDQDEAGRFEASIELDKLEFIKDQCQFTHDTLESLPSLQITFNIQNLQHIPHSDITEKHYRFDFSATNLKLKPKMFSIFKSTPLLSFYELVGNDKITVLFESDISKIDSCDPFWTVTCPIPQSQISPSFTINVYQSIDQEKSKISKVASVCIEFESIIGEEQETMFDVPGTQGKTVIMLDRIQVVQ